MRMKSLVVTSAAAALLLVPAGALAGGPPPGRGGGDPAKADRAHGHRPATIPAAEVQAPSEITAALRDDAAPTAEPQTSPTESGTRRAYGRYCQGQSKKHVKGRKGTPFSRCVTAMARLDDGDVRSPAKACKGLSKKHMKGKKGTPFSRCVSSAARLLKDRDDEGDDSSTTYADPFGDD
jgi:hypothetical protein